MRQQTSIFQNLDWILVGLYLTLVVMGWLNIYAAVFNEDHASIFDINEKYGKQMIWIITAIVIAAIILIIDGSFYTTFSYPIYIIGIIALIAVLFFGTDVKGSRSWFRFGEIGIQPAEFAKFTTNPAPAFRRQNSR